MVEQQLPDAEGAAHVAGRRVAVGLRKDRRRQADEVHGGSGRPQDLARGNRGANCQRGEADAALVGENPRRQRQAVDAGESRFGCRVRIGIRVVGLAHPSPQLAWRSAVRQQLPVGVFPNLQLKANAAVDGATCQRQVGVAHAVPGAERRQGGDVFGQGLGFNGRDGGCRPGAAHALEPVRQAGRASGLRRADVIACAVRRWRFGHVAAALRETAARNPVLVAGEGLRARARDLGYGVVQARRCRHDVTAARERFRRGAENAAVGGDCRGDALVVRRELAGCFAAAPARQPNQLVVAVPRTLDVNEAVSAPLREQLGERVALGIAVLRQEAPDAERTGGVLESLDAATFSERRAQDVARQADEVHRGRALRAQHRQGRDRGRPQPRIEAVGVRTHGPPQCQFRAEDVRQALVGPEDVRLPVPPAPVGARRLARIDAAQMKTPLGIESLAKKMGVAFQRRARRRGQIAVVPRMQGAQVRMVLELQGVDGFVGDRDRRLGARSHEEHVAVAVVEAAGIGQPAIGLARRGFALCALGRHTVDAEGTPAGAPLLGIVFFPGDASHPRRIAALEGRHRTHRHRLREGETAHCADFRHDPLDPRALAAADRECEENRKADAGKACEAQAGGRPNGRAGNAPRPIAKGRRPFQSRQRAAPAPV